LQRAAQGIDRLKHGHISKYNAFDPAQKPAEKDYVLVVDQTRGDASIRLGAADEGRFAAMLQAARAEHPGALILIKTHPEVSAGKRKGHYSAADLDHRTRFLDDRISPWHALAGAQQVYCVTSLMGFEAILAGHRPRIFGRPFYAGWGLSDDRQPMDRRHRGLTPEGLFAGAMLLYPHWYDPYRDCLCTFEDVADTLEARSRAWREDRPGYDAYGIRLWKRGHVRRFFGGNVRFPRRPAAPARKRLVWAGKEKPEQGASAAPIIRLEDGFLRSKGLGAELVPPMSLVADDRGIYYDPNRPSRLEDLINASDDLPAPALQRAERLRQRLTQSGLSKYNIGAKTNGWPSDRLRIQTCSRPWSRCR